MTPYRPLHLLLLCFAIYFTACATDVCPSQSEGADKPNQRKLKGITWGYSASISPPIRLCGSVPCQGRITDLHDNGAIAQIAFYNSGILNGRFASFYDNGVRERTENMLKATK